MRPLRTTLSNKNLVNMGVPKALLNLRLDDLEIDHKIKEFIKEYIGENFEKNRRDNRGLFFYGSNGTGKTSLASLIVRESYRRRYTAKRILWAEYITLNTNTWNCNDYEVKSAMQDVVKDIKEREVLVIDEIGKETETKVSINLLEDLLRFREDKCLVTIICTNLTPSTIRDRYGASIESLIKGNMTPIKLVGEDKRRV